VVVLAQTLNRKFAVCAVLSTDCACTVTVAVELTTYDPIEPEIEQLPAVEPILT
jgi:hypothetical protein